MKLSVEYLIIIERKSAEAFYRLCGNISEFNKLLQSEPNISINRNRITHNQVIECDYVVKSGEIEEKQQRFFHVKFTFDGNDGQVDPFSDLLRTVKGLTHRLGAPPETLWDDVSLYYSQKAYPQIHQVENLMRKLITYFMLTTVGKQWITENLPKPVEDAVEKSKRKQYLDILHQVDFIHLGDFLFRPYSTRKVISDLFDELDNIESVDELNLGDLREYVPRSNWERYFSTLVECDDRYLKNRWEKLYELRCKVAHNALVTKGDYIEIESLASDIREKLQKALNNLDKVYIPDEDKEQVAENVVGNINALYGEFIQSWKTFESALNKVSDFLGTTSGTTRPIKAPSHHVRNLHELGFIEEGFLQKCQELIRFRNQLVHDANIAVSEIAVSDYISQLEQATEKILGLAGGGSWREEIVNALRSLGGKASLSELYDYIKDHTLRDLPDNWKATIRYTLQVNSSSSKTFSGGKDVFVRLDKGFWALREDINDSSKAKTNNDGHT